MNDPFDNRLLLPVEEAAAALGVGRTTTWDLIKRGLLDTRQIGRRRLVTIESVRRIAADGAAKQ
jgi:excisionase family DNA binding protein